MSLRGFFLRRITTKGGIMLSPIRAVRFLLYLVECQPNFCDCFDGSSCGCFYRIRVSDSSVPCVRLSACVGRIQYEEVVPTRFNKFFERGNVGAIPAAPNNLIRRPNPSTIPALRKSCVSQLFRKFVVHKKLYHETSGPHWH
jgi:hypothetical protein